VNAAFAGSLKILIHLYYGVVLFGLLILQAGLGIFAWFTVYNSKKVNNGLIHKIKLGHKVLVTLIF
jgi:hypothetical protein